MNIRGSRVCGTDPPNEPDEQDPLARPALRASRKMHSPNVRHCRFGSLPTNRISRAGSWQ